MISDECVNNLENARDEREKGNPGLELIASSRDFKIRLVGQASRSVRGRSLG